MDKIIFYIILFYFISIFFRFLKDKDKKKRGQRPTLPPQPSHYPAPTRPPPRPSRQEGLGKPSRPILTPQEREALHILDEWEIRASRLKSRIPVPPRPTKKREISRAKTDEKPVLKREKPMVKEKITAPEEAFFSRPADVKQGIIISEILRPPLARRNLFLPPYLRG